MIDTQNYVTKRPPPSRIHQGSDVSLARLHHVGVRELGSTTARCPIRRFFGHGGNVQGPILGDRRTVQPFCSR